MRQIHITTIVLALTASFALTSGDLRAQETLDLWPAGKVPGEPSGIGAESVQKPKPGETKGVMRIENVTRPTITVYPAPADSNTGAAVVIAPGGGYNILAYDLEGTEVAQWLNSIGVTGIVLKYRVPRRPGTDSNTWPMEPLQDAQRALSLTRQHASQWSIDPNRIGILGFSAGGNLSARAATGFDTRSYEPIDEADTRSCRPDFAVLVYPAYLDREGVLDERLPVTAETPPCFFAHAADDRIGPQNSIRLFLALREKSVPAELHIFETGGHGFGLRASEHPCSTWPDRCGAWMKARGLLNQNGGQ